MPIFAPIQEIVPNPPVPDMSLPGWPIETTHLDWESDTRLRKIEEALLKLMTPPS